MIKKLFFFIIVLFLSMPVYAAELQPFAFTFTGKWDATSNPLLIDDNGLQDIQNVRKVGKQFKGVYGHSAINSTLLSSYPYILNGFHFRKDQPQESHVIVYSADSMTPTSAVLYKNTTAIPNAGDFSTSIFHTNSSVTNLGRFAIAPRGNMIYTNGNETLIWGGNEIEPVSFVTSGDSLSGSATILTNPNDYSELVQNTRQDSAQIANITTGANYWLVGFFRPLNGVKFYVKDANVSLSTMSAWEWNGEVWTTLSISSDGTSSGGKTLAQTGSVNFSSTSLTSKIRYINGLSLYWYQFHISAGSATVYYTTVNSPIQQIYNIWDGVEDSPVKFLISSGSIWQDYTDYVIDDDETTGAVLSSMSTANYVVLGFLQQQQAISIRMVALSENTTPSTMYLYYNGFTDWVVGNAVSDGTSNGSASLSKSGTVVYKPLSKSTEFKKSIGDEFPLYYYKISFSNTLGSNVKIAEVTGIPNPTQIATYSFAETFQNRLFLFDDISENRNGCAYSSFNSPDIFNGTDSGTLTFGNKEKVTAASVVYNVFQDGAVEQMIVTKSNETWRLSGDNPSNWSIQKMSSTIGCIAPLTMVKADTTDTGQTQQRQVVIWMSDKGVFLTDGAIIIPISDDIKSYFDPDDSRYIPTAMQSKSIAWYDPSIRSYKLLVASGAGATYLNTELEYSLKYKEWTKLYRENTSGANPLQSGWLVYDSYGTSYTYGGARLGDVYRLENSYTWSGTPITQYLHTKDIILDTERPLFRKTAVKNLITAYFQGGTAYKKLQSYEGIQLITESGDKLITEGDTISFWHYGDGGDVTVNGIKNQSVPTYIPTANKKYDIQSVNMGPFLYHSFKFQQTTNTLHGMELAGMGVYYEPFTVLR